MIAHLMCGIGLGGYNDLPSAAVANMADMHLLPGMDGWPMHACCSQS